MTYSKKFDSGLRLIVKKIDGLLSVSFGVLVGTGSCFETEDENGISHFIEHMLFKGTKKRNAFEISDAMDRIGAQVNAFTSKDITCYYSKSTSDHAGEAFEILSDFFLHSVFPEEEIAREKGVVLEEISMTEDTPDDLCLDVLAQAYFGDEGYGRPILGSSENVSSFTKSDIEKYIHERYNPENIVISFAGNIDEKYAEELVEKYFEREMQKRVFVPRGKKISLKGANLFRKKDIEQAHIALAYPSLPRDHKLSDAVQIVNTVLGGGMSSRLFQTVREKLGLAYSVFSYVSTFEEGGLLTVYAGVNPKNTKKAVDEILRCIDDLKKDCITKDEFERGKEQVKSSLILAQENTASQMILYGKEMLFKNEVFDFSARIGKIDSLTLSDCERAISMNFDEKYRASSIIGKVDRPLTF